MGAYSPAPVVTPQVHARVMREIIMPTIKGMEQDGIPFTGFLYAGLMIDKAGQVKTLEFNCRMGDPETQPIMMRLKTDLVDVLIAATEPHPTVALQDIELQWDRQSAVGVVMASHGYPATSRSGDVISGLPADSDDAVVFHAATKMDGNAVTTSGGRVLCVCALGGTLKLAQQKAYDALNHIQFDGMQFRHDIGYRAIQR
jgi:phosphoribosylamine--glycine ligase